MRSTAHMSEVTLLNAMLKESRDFARQFGACEAPEPSFPSTVAATCRDGLFHLGEEIPR